ncbi:MAG: pilus assembly protein [Nitrospirae bacterium]|nr:pilus assembly protein [Nitrospirota bacterium]
MSITVVKRLRQPLDNSRGATAVMVALSLTVLLAMAAAAIDVGHALVARNELQNAADAAALAGARTLGVAYEGMTPAAMAAYTLTGGDHAAIVADAQAAAVLNQAAAVNVTVNAADVGIGLWDSATRTFAVTANQPRAVNVVTHRDGSANGPISTFLAGVVGMTSVNVSAVATAELTALGSTPPGALDLPLAISQLFFSQYGCGDSIMLYPSNGTPQSCAGFTTFNQSPSNDIAMRNIINGMINGTYQAPPTTAGQTQLNFTNGTLSNPTWTALVNLFNAKKDASGVWDALVPVYQGNSCHPSGAIPIVGYANIAITNVHGQPGATIVGNVSCPLFQSGGVGGGPAFGVFTTVPGLVQ